MALDTIKEAGTGNSQPTASITGDASLESADLKATSTPNVEKSSPSINTTPSEDNNAPLDAKSPTSTPSKESEEKKEQEAPKDEKLASKFAALSRKERQVVAKQQELKAAEAKIAEERSKMIAEVEAEKAKVQSEIKKVQEFEQLKKMNPLKAMEFLGYTYQQLGEIFLNDGKPTPEQEINRVKSEMEERLEAYKREQLESAKKAQEEQELKAKKAQEEETKRIEAERLQVIEEFQTEINEYLLGNQDNYELINTNEQHDLVFATVEQHFEKTGRVLSIKEAADLVERFLEQQVEKNLATKKLKAKVSPPSTAKVEQAPKEDTQVKSQETAPATPVAKSKTITNDMTASSISKPADTEEERWKRALAALG